MTNIVLLVGNLGADPESRTTNGGTDVTTFSLGTSRPRRDSEGKTYNARKPAFSEGHSALYRKAVPHRTLAA